MSGTALLTYDTLSALSADLSPAAGTYAQVLNDASNANNVVYKKAGGSGTGSWSPSGSVDAEFVQPASLFSIGTLPRRLDQYIADGEVHLLGMNIAQADGSTDDYLNINALIVDLAAAGGGTVKFDRPKTSGGYYRISRPIQIFDYIHCVGDGRSTEVRNVAYDLVNFWNNEAFFMGAYGAWPQADSAFAETSYQLNSITSGTTTVTFTTTAQAANFLVGDLIWIATQTTLLPTGLPAYVHMDEVLAVNTTTGVVTLAHMIPDSMTSPVIYRQTNTLASLELPGGGIARMVRGSSLRNMRITQVINDTSQSGQLLALSTYECSLEDLWLEGCHTLAMDVCAYTRLRNINAKYRRTGLEMAYLHCDNDIDGLYIARVANPAKACFDVQVSECGRDISISNFRISTYNFSGSTGQATLQASTRRCKFYDGTVIGSQGCAVGVVSTMPISADDRSAQFDFSNITVIDPTTEGFVLNGTAGRVRGCRVLGTQSGNNAIFIGSGAVGNVIDGNTLGTPGARTIADSVWYDGGASYVGTVANNESYFTDYARPLYDITSVTLTGSTANTMLKSYALPANTTPTFGGATVLVRLTVAGTAGTKTIQLARGVGVVGSAVLSAATTGEVELRFRVQKASGTSAIGWMSGSTALGVIPPTSVTLSLNVVTNASDLAVYGKLGNSGDSITIELFQVEFNSTDVNHA